LFDASRSLFCYYREEYRNDQTSIIMNRLDLERLERLLDSDANRRLPGIESLWTELSRASVVDPTEVPFDVVTINSTERFVDDSNGTVGTSQVPLDSH
jgi:hypothetical protein